MGWGDALADVGLVSQGMNTAIAANQDRDYQLEQRRIQQEQQAAALAQFRREQAFQQDMRNVVQGYSADGPNAVPAVAGAPATMQDDGTETEEGTPQPAVQSSPAKTNINGMFKAMQDVAIKHGRADDYSAIAAKARAYHQEGLLDFVRAANQGATPDKLEDIFNSSGDVKLQKGTLQPDGGGGFTGVTTDNQPVALNPKDIMQSLLTPKDYFTEKDKSEIAQVRAQAAQLAAEARQYGADQVLQGKLAQVAAASSVNDARSNLMDAQAELARVKADGGGTVTRTAKTPGEWNAFDRNARQAATQAAMEQDEFGKPKLNKPRMLSIYSMAMRMAHDSPEDYPSAGEAVAGALDKMQEIDRLKSDAQDQAETEAKDLPFTTPKQHDKWVQSRTDSLVQSRRGAGTSPASLAPTSAPSVAAGAPASAVVATKDNPAKPASQADFKALPSGTYFVNPADGKVMVKK